MSPQPLVWTSAIDTTGTQTFCGECGHPMHWHECGAGVALTSGPCRCRNDTYSPLDPDPLDATEQERARSDFLHPEPELHPVRGCSVISWLLLSWAIAALLLIAVVVAVWR